MDIVWHSSAFARTKKEPQSGSALFSGTILWYLMQHQQCPLSQQERVRVRGFVP